MRAAVSLVLALAAAPFLRGQDPSLREALQQAKLLWGEQGDRDGAAARLQQVLTALEPQARTLDAGWSRVLLEAYAWMAVLEDRVPAHRAKAQKYLDALLDLEPDVELDKGLLNARLQGYVDSVRTSRFFRMNLVLQPEGGTLRLDGREVPARTGLRHLPPGDHQVQYERPGHKPLALTVSGQAREVRPVEMKLERVSSTVRFSLWPSDTTVRLDGKVAIAPLAPGGAPREVVVEGLGPGAHQMELSAPCSRPRRINIPASFTEPLADHVLEALSLERAESHISVAGTIPEGRAFLDERPLGPLPVKDALACPGTYTLRVEFPYGGFTQRVELPDKGQVSVVARPRPRLVVLGMQALAERDRLVKRLRDLGKDLGQVAYQVLPAGESVEDLLARLRVGRSAELWMQLRPQEGLPAHRLVCVVGTFTGEESRFEINALDEDPLAAVVATLNRVPRFFVPDAGLVLADAREQTGPWVIATGAAAEAAGFRAGTPLTAVEGNPCPDRVAFQAALEKAQGSLKVSQGTVEAALAVRPALQELPTHAADLCYALVLVQARLARMEAKGDDAARWAFIEAQALMHFQAWDKAVERLREAKLPQEDGVGAGTAAYHLGQCLLKLGQVFLPEARKAFAAAAADTRARFQGPHGPKVAPFAQMQLDALKP